MSEYASEAITIPTHAKWGSSLKDLIEQITSLDGESIAFDALCKDQEKTIKHLIALVVSLDRFIEYRDSRANSQFFLDIFIRDEKQARTILSELGIDLPLLYALSRSE